MSGADGILSFNVWPSYIGLAADHQEFVPVEQRAQIWWRTVCADCGRLAPCGDEAAGWTPTQPPQIVGAAGGPNSGNSQGCWVPAGTYHKYLFYNSPDGPSTAFMWMPHPHVQLVDGWVVVDPITNTDTVAQLVSGIAR